MRGDQKRLARSIKAQLQFERDQKIRAKRVTRMTIGKGLLVIGLVGLFLVGCLIDAIRYIETRDATPTLKCLSAHAIHIPETRSLVVGEPLVKAHMEVICDAWGQP